MNDYFRTHATPEELKTLLGDHWSIRARTKNNLGRYLNCVTRKQYDQANLYASSLRTALVMFGSTAAAGAVYLKLIRQAAEQS